MAASLKEIAEKAGVHTSTVSLALRGNPKISAQTRDSIKQIAESLNYVPNLMARGLAGASTKTIGVLVPKLRDSFVIDCMGAQERWMQDQGYTPLLVVTHGNKEVELSAINDIIGRGADGLIIDYVPSSTEVVERIQKYVDSGGYVGMLGHCRDIKGIDTVDQYFLPCGYETTKHLLELGHRRIAFTLMSLADERQQLRLEGYRKALAEFDVKYEPLLVFELDYIRQDITQLRKEAMSFKQRPTAICAYNDDLASELVMDLMNAGYDVPGDVSVTGVNDGWYSSKLKVPLTTYRLPTEQIGQKLAELLINRISSESVESQNTLFEGELVVRESTGKL
ncbi:MAG: LacI family DNA-binding transcriptional regulator [Sedimentisphaeraceae bacterium JB056]